MFYHFNQNNSGGSFHFNEEKGITHHVVIEADNASDANAVAERIDIYFDGIGDCSCCGRRWSPAEERDGEDFPHVYGEKVNDYVNSKYFYPWMDDGKEVCVYYKNGRKEWF